MQAVGCECEPKVTGLDDVQVGESFRRRLEFVVVDGTTGRAARVVRRDPEDLPVLAGKAHEPIDIAGIGAPVIGSKVDHDRVRTLRDGLSPLVHIRRAISADTR